MFCKIRRKTGLLVKISSHIHKLSKNPELSSATLFTYSNLIPLLSTRTSKPIIYNNYPPYTFYRNDMSIPLDKLSAKILVLGDSGVGKSSLIHLICHSNVLNSPQWTIGCSIDVKLHENCFLEFWDIGGSRGHKIARSFLYQEYHGFMLVFDATNKKSRSNLDEWLSEATLKQTSSGETRHSERQVPIIYIGTKSDQLPQNTAPMNAYHQLEGCSIVDLHHNMPVLFVDTQDPLSLSHNSDNHKELQRFFRRIIDRRLNKFNF